MTAAQYTPAVIAAARALCKNASDICNVNDDDNWKIYGDQFLNEAQIALNAAGFQEAAAAEPTEAQRQQIIAEFLERTGQYVTNDASREAAIADAWKCGRILDKEGVIIGCENPCRARQGAAC